MLLPTQVAASTAITDSMQTILDTIEERRKQAEENKTGQKKDSLLEARISASTENRRAQGRIAEALFGMNKVDINELKIQLMDKLGENLGISREDGMSSYAYGRAIEGALKSVGASGLDDLAKELGLGELDLSLKNLVAAIKNPWGEENDRLEKALEKQHGDGKTTTDEQAKILQRLDDVSNPKTLEELKLGPQGADPTRVEDDETRAEQLDDIKAKEASEKLEDVRETQDVINDRHEENQASRSTDSASDAPAVIDDVLMLSLTSHAETLEPVQDGLEEGPQVEAGEGDGSITAERQDAETPEALQASEKEPIAAEQTLSTRMQVDDIGIYDTLKRRHFSTPA